MNVNSHEPDGKMDRRDFLCGAAGATALGVVSCLDAAVAKEDVLDVWQRETDLVKAEVFRQYYADGMTRGLKSLERVEDAFEKVFREAQTVEVKDVPAVWSVYNMGYIVKTRETLFSIDLVHRRAAEFAPLLDFSLVTHNHNDHYHPGLYAAMNSSKKLVVSNFLDNYGAYRWNRETTGGGFTRAEKEFRIKDVTVRTSLVDHNDYLIDFTTAFEIRVGDWKLYHTGDCSVADKIGTVWGAPDLWLFFPMGALNVSDAVERVRPKRIVIGHIWELAHSSGRLTTPMVRSAIEKASTFCPDVRAGLWGDRLT